MTDILARVKAWQAAKCENSQSNEAYLEFCQQKFYEIRRMMPELIAECERLKTEIIDLNMTYQRYIGCPGDDVGLLKKDAAKWREIAIELKAKELHNQRGWEVLPENDWQSVYYKFKGVSKTTIMYGKRHYREQAERELEAK